MKYIVPSSKIVFTDFMILLVSVLMGLNSVMSFSEDNKERWLPPVKLPTDSQARRVGSTGSTKAVISFVSGEKGKRYFYNQKEVGLMQLIEYIQKSNVRSIVLRGDREALFQWEEFCRLSSKLMKVGVKEISYATSLSRGK